MKARLTLHHDDPSCNARLSHAGFCAECGFTPDMQSTILIPYCPLCDLPLRNMKCSECERVFETPRKENTETAKKDSIFTTSRNDVDLILKRIERGEIVTAEGKFAAILYIISTSKRDWRENPEISFFHMICCNQIEKRTTDRLFPKFVKGKRITTEERLAIVAGVLSLLSINWANDPELSLLYRVASSSNKLEEKAS